jgi:hypothetical protein
VVRTFGRLSDTYGKFVGIECGWLGR